VYRALVLALAIAEAAASGSLVDAVARRDSGAVRSLLRQHADVNARDADGATALQWAAHWNDVETASLLIDAGAHVNAANDLGVSPLMLASTNGSVEMVNRLLDAGANPNGATRSGETVLMTAARTGALAVVKALLDRGAAVNAREPNHGQTALMWAVAEKHPDISRELLARGAAPDLRSQTGLSALMFAAQQGDLPSARLLLEAGADVNQTAADGNTPLLMASASRAAITASNYHLLPKAERSRGGRPRARRARRRGFSPRRLRPDGAPSCRRDAQNAAGAGAPVTGGQSERAAHARPAVSARRLRVARRLCRRDAVLVRRKGGGRGADENPGRGRRGCEPWCPGQHVAADGRRRHG